MGLSLSPGMDWTRFAVGGAAARPDSFTGLDQTFAANVYRMVQDAHNAGIPLQITSAYRSPELQAELYQNAIKKYGSPEAARKWVAPPGRSRHNSGTAVDFALNGSLIRDANSDAAKWIAANAANYGLAVPMAWEPWQVEPVGSRQGGTPRQTVSTNSPQGLLPTMQQEAPQMQQEKVGGLLGRLFPNMDADRADEIRLGLQGLLHNPNAARVGAIQARMGERADNRKTQAAAAQAQQQANRTAQWLAQQPGGQQYAQAIASGALPAGEALQMWRQASQGPQYRQVTGEQAAAMGLDPSQVYNVGADGKVTGIGAGSTNINVNTASEVGTIPPGYELFTDPDTKARRLRPIPGGPVDTEQRQAAAAQERATQAQESQQQTTDNVVLNQVSAIREMLNTGGMFDLPEAGILGNALGRMGINQEAVNMRNRLATLEGMVSFDQLAKMREASPTGGALGAISERELTLLSAQLGTLDQSSDPQTIMETLDLLENVMRKADAYPNAAQFGFGGTPQAAPKVKTYNPQTGRLE